MLTNQAIRDARYAHHRKLAMNTARKANPGGRVSSTSARDVTDDAVIVAVTFMTGGKTEVWTYRVNLDATHAEKADQS